MNNFHVSFLIDETEKELNVIKCCLPEVEEESEVSDVETIPDDINLDELSGKVSVLSYFADDVNKMIHSFLFRS